jgi:hypothetical protein
LILPIVVISFVFDGPHRTVGFDQRVSSLDVISFSHFPLLFVITGVRIFHGVVEFIRRMGLKCKENYENIQFKLLQLDTHVVIVMMGITMSEVASSI